MASEDLASDQASSREESVDAYDEFVGVVRRLRKECPWDREQTHESVRHLLIEEAYEVVEAIDENDLNLLKRELGDVFLHVIFHSVIAEENGTFSIDDVIRLEMQKLIRRHPHVFGDADAETSEEVLENWEKQKQSEKGRSSSLDGVPAHLPALLRAYRIQQKAAGVGFDFPEKESAWSKVDEELKEFRSAVQDDADLAEIEQELGDVFFALVNYSRFIDCNPENALRETTRKFEKRFRYIEQALAAEDKTIEESTLEEMDHYWDEAKVDHSSSREK